MYLKLWQNSLGNQLLVRECKLARAIIQRSRNILVPHHLAAVLETLLKEILVSSRHCQSRAIFSVKACLKGEDGFAAISNR